jgi:integrase
VGWTVTRPTRGGRERYRACYRDLRGVIQTAGTFDTERKADRAWQAAEAKVYEGSHVDLRKGRRRFESYVRETWLPNHVTEPSTRESYTYSIGKHLISWFGKMRMIDITSAEVREWVTHMIASGASPKTIFNNKVILSAIFTTAIADGIVHFHPCRLVKTPTVPVKPLRIITPEQFDRLHQAIPVEIFRLFVETDIETGLRYGELSELRPKDLHRPSRTLTVSRAVVRVNPRFHPTGARFHVKEYPKDKESRSFKLSRNISDKLWLCIDARKLGPDDLIFEMLSRPTASVPVASKPVTGDAGLTEPNGSGRSYRHGTLSGYSAGRCRCDVCKRAYARYRASRRANGKDEPRAPRTVDTDGHIPGDWFRQNIWYPAVAAADIGFRVRPKDLRAAHASWLLAGGADLQAVKERLGHASITTTERYLRTLPDDDETAVEAFERVRHRSVS